MESLDQLKQVVALVAKEFAQSEFRDQNWQVTEIGEIQVAGADVAWRISGTSDDPAVRTMLVLGYYRSATDQAVLVFDVAALAEDAEWVAKVVESFALSER